MILLLAAAAAFMVVKTDQCRAMGRKPEPAPANGRIMVQFEEGVSEERARQIVQEEGCEVVRRLVNLDIYVVSVPAGLEVERAVERLSVRPEIRYAEPDAKAQPLEGR